MKKSGKKWEKIILASIMTAAVSISSITVAPTSIYAEETAATNLSFGTAAELKFNSSVGGELNEPKYYSFTIDETCTVSINATIEVFSGFATIGIYDEDKALIDSYTFRGTDSFQNMYLNGGKYYIMLQAGNNSGTYNMTVMADTVNESFKENTEQFDDTSDRANRINFSNKYNGALTYNDNKDWFKFDMPVQGKIIMDGKNAASDYIRYTIYDDSKTSEYTNRAKAGSNITENISLAPGTHYILIEKEDEKCLGSYKFILDYVMDVPAVTVKNSATKKIAVKWTDIAGADGYEMQYCISAKFKSGVKKKSYKEGVNSASITNLKNGKTYYVRMRTYVTVNGKKKYSGWSTLQSVKILK